MMPRKPLVRFALAALAGALLTACGSDPVFPPDFDESLHIDLAAMTRTASGLYYLDLVVGTGAVAAAGKQATVTYTGWLADARQFDAGSFTVTLGAGQVIDGFDEGVTGMKVGGKRRLVIPPKLGYGKEGVGAIPPNATLIFDVELTAVK